MESRDLAPKSSDLATNWRYAPLSRQSWRPLSAASCPKRRFTRAPLTQCCVAADVRGMPPGSGNAARNDQAVGEGKSPVPVPLGILVSLAVPGALVALLLAWAVDFVACDEPGTEACARHGLATAQLW